MDHPPARAGIESKESPLRSLEAEIRRLDVRERRRWLAALGLLVLVAGRVTFGALAAVGILGPGAEPAGSLPVLLDLGMLATLVLYWQYGLRERRALRKTREEVLRLVRQHEKETEDVCRAKTQFLANMSHEIRTPLTGVIGMTEIVLDSDLTKEQREHLSIAMKCADSLLTMINDLLDFTRIEAKKMEVEKVEFDLRALVEDVGDALAYRATEKSLELVCHVNPSVPAWVRGDPARLRQILMNLVGNALRFTEKGEVVLSVQTEKLEDKRATLVFSVSDTGVGVPEEMLQKIFDRFTQVDASSARQYGGVGLGLAVCKELVELMGGEIWVESVRGAGSTFGFRLPFEISEVRPAQVKRASILLRDARLMLEGRRVLVVDDNATNRLILERMLKQWAVEVQSAVSGSTALTALRHAASSSIPFDLVVLDVQMPFMDGFRVERAIRRHGCYGSPKILMLSSIGGAMEQGVPEPSPETRFMAKPVKQSALLETLLDVFLPRRAVVRAYGAAPGDVKRLRYKARVLVADHDEASRSQIARVLIDCGYDVTTTENGLIALGLLTRKSFDLVLMDSDMPVLDGVQACRKIRADASAPNLPILGIVSGGSSDRRRTCVEAGMDDCLRRPVYADDLLRMVEQWLPGPQEEADAEAPASVAEGETERRDPPTLDVEKALEMLGGDRGLFREILTMFVSAIPETVDGLRKGIAEVDFESLKFRAHNPKGTAACVCAEAIRDTAQRLEVLVQGRDLEEAEKTLQTLEREFGGLQRAASSVESILGSLVPSAETPDKKPHPPAS
jgi:signal transduction histidine kinase/CheY-like chemotaxis protein/HPt (histidine-containing phosphotransfer) domain-containing protein